MKLTSSAAPAPAGTATLRACAKVVSVTSLCAATHSPKAGEAPSAPAGAAGAAMEGPAAAARSSPRGGSAGQREIGIGMQCNTRVNRWRSAAHTDKFTCPREAAKLSLLVADTANISVGFSQSSITGPKWW